MKTPVRGPGAEAKRLLSSKGYVIERFVEAKSPVVASVRQVDVEHAVPGSPETCVLARWGDRTNPPDAGTAWLFFRTVAYRLDIRKRVATRYMLGEKARAAVSNWDKTRGASGFAPGEYHLLAPQRSNTLVYKTRDYRKNKWDHKSRGGSPAARKHIAVGTRRWVG